VRPHPVHEGPEIGAGGKVDVDILRPAFFDAVVDGIATDRALIEGRAPVTNIIDSAI
jgi:hypothetical protein